MASFFVYWNSIKKTVRIHRAACGACKNGEGMHERRIDAGRTTTYDWLPYPTYKAALAEAQTQARKLGAKAKLDCGLCNPQNP
ncbi:MAG: hypothetical protein WAW54_09330 [Parvibaculum sedimenti]|uniref:hypothetical protein n=1 Tax=Parvibaculum sedimenti TaxID=2608632 RepID=UPI003BB6CA1D